MSQKELVVDTLRRKREKGEKTGGVLQGRVEREKKGVGEDRRRDTIEEPNPTVE